MCVCVCVRACVKDIRAFRKAVLYFSVARPGNSGYYQSGPVVYEYMRDGLIEFARNVIIPIPHRVGRTIRVDLHFDAKWLMISEVRFESGTAAYGAFSASTLLVGRQEGHPDCKNN